MNKIVLMGRLTRDPELRYGGTDQTAVAHYSIAVERRVRKDGDPEADFFNCVSFGKQAEFIERYLRKGMKVALDGEMRNNNYTNKEGRMVYTMQVVTSNIEFAESKRAAEEHLESAPDENGFMNTADGLEEEMPFR